MRRSVALDISDVVSAILVLACTKTTVSIPRSAIHSILWKMQPEESLLSRVRFSITGDVCFSRDIDTAIHLLIARGTLRAAKDGTILPNEIPTLRSLNHARHTHPQFDALLSASRNFHKMLVEWKTQGSSEITGKKVTA
ncbi:MAG: hypothetical protein C3F14_09925 [Deltaproteobacteria bacterium]|nr:MAG: hypothetical protein C3F14_09925 [Deltaproteobacteria bacterium]